MKMASYAKYDSSTEVTHLWPSTLWDFFSMSTRQSQSGDQSRRCFCFRRFVIDKLRKHIENQVQIVVCCRTLAYSCMLFRALDVWFPILDAETNYPSGCLAVYSAFVWLILLMHWSKLNAGSISDYANASELCNSSCVIGFAVAFLDSKV